MLSPGDRSIAVTTKKSGIVLASEADALQSPRVEGSMFGFVFNQVVDDWHAKGDDAQLLADADEFHVATTDLMGPVHRLSLAQHAQRAANISPKPSACVAQAAAAHPLQPYLLTGSAPGYLHLWEFGSGRLRVTYAPLPFSHHLLGAAGDVPQPARVSHWSYAAGVAFSESGSRFAAVGKGGWTAVWRQDARWAPTPHGQVGCCDWGHHCLAKNGSGIAFVGASASVIAVGGAGANKCHVSLWDTLVPLPSACVAALPCGPKHVNALCVLEDGLTLLAGLASGGLLAFDLRMMGKGRGAEPMWTADAAHPGGVSCVAACPGDLRPRHGPGGSGPLFASGGKDGRVLLWDAGGKQLQALELLHWSPARTYFAFSHSEERVAAKVKSVAFHSSGLLSCGHNSRVLLTPWAHL